jgi:hypothetical protein
VRAGKIDNLDAAITSRLASSGYTAPDNTSIASILSRADVAISSRAAASDYTSGRAAKLDYLDASISSISASTANIPTSLSADISTILSRADVNVSTRASAADYTSVRAGRLDNIDATVSSRLAASGYTAPANGSIATILSRVDVPVSSVANAYGAGSISYTVTVTAANGSTPIEGVAVWISTNSNGSNVIAGTAYTNMSGQVTFMLDAGSYYIWRQLSGWTFANPTAFTVT